MERYQPSYFNGYRGISFDADPRFDLGIEGTIEVVLAVPDELDAEKLPCVLAHGDPDTDTHYQIVVSERRNAVRLFLDRGLRTSEIRNPVGKWIEAPVDLTDGELHQIAFVIEGSIGHAVVDGKRIESIFEFRLEKRAALNIRPLHIGWNGSGDGFLGWISTVRLWTKALTAEQLQWSIGFEGLPTKTNKAYESLAVYTQFTDARNELKIASAAVFNTPMVGNEEEGELVEIPQPPNLHPGAIFTRYGAQGLTDLIVEYSGPRRKLNKFAGDPVVVEPRKDYGSKSALRDLFQARRELQRLEKEAAEDAANKLIGSQAQGADEIFNSKVMVLRNEILGFVDDAISNREASEVGTDKIGAFRMDWLEGIHSIVGIHDGVTIRALWVVTNRRISEEPLLLMNGSFHHLKTQGSEVFSLDVPPGASFAGIRLRRSDQGIHCIGLSYSYREDALVDSGLNLITNGAWIDRNQREPFRDDVLTADLHEKVETVRLHGTYENTMLFRFSHDPLSNKLFLYQIRPSNTKDAIKVREFTHQKGNLWHEQLETGYRRLVIGQDQIHWIDADLDGGRVLVRPDPYDAGNEDKISWGGTFSLDQRPALTLANFRAYNPIRMLPRDYQADTGSSKLLFQFPEENSKDYFISSTNEIVPHGLFFRSDIKGADRARTEVAASSHEHQSSWAFNVGLKAGVKGLVSFSDKFSYKHELEVMNATKTVTTISRTVETRYALVVDLARIALHPSFRERVLELRNLFRVDRPRDYLRFFNSFGTHYPYAITYGGMAYLEQAFDETKYKELEREEVGVKISMSGTLEKIISAGVSGGADFSFGEIATGETSTSRTIFGSYGGSISRGEGWTLPEGEEVPLLLDLRPIYQLLTPAHFDDPLVWNQLREEMEMELNEYNQLWLEHNRPPWIDNGMVPPDWFEQITVSIP